MEESFHPTGWLDFIVGSHNKVDFSNPDNFDDSFGKLIKNITNIEKELCINPRKSSFIFYR